MSTASNAHTAIDIERQMKQVRRDLDNQVDELVDNARQITEQITDWRSYVAAHPWISLGVAVAAGYLVIPTRVSVDRPVSETLADLARTGSIKLGPPDSNLSVWDRAVDLGLGMASSAALQIGMNLLNRGMSQLLSASQEVNSPSKAPVRERNRS